MKRKTDTLTITHPELIPFENLYAALAGARVRGFETIAGAIQVAMQAGMDSVRIYGDAVEIVEAICDYYQSCMGHADAAEQYELWLEWHTVLNLMGLEPQAFVYA